MGERRKKKRREGKDAVGVDVGNGKEAEGNEKSRKKLVEEIKDFVYVCT